MSLHHPATEILPKSVFRIFVLSFICWEHLRDRLIFRRIQSKQSAVRLVYLSEKEYRHWNHIH